MNTIDDIKDKFKDEKKADNSSKRKIHRLLKKLKGGDVSVKVDLKFSF